MKSLIHPALIGWSAFSKSGSESLEVSDALPSSKLANSQLSEVSGTTAHTYGAHGALESTLDARGILRSRTLDVLDRVTQTSWMGDASLTVDQTWDDPLVDYSIGRLTAIARHGTSVDYEYDVFGRVTRDGDLTYVYDGNGNRVSVGYPGGTTATYGFDFADRHETLDVQVGVDPPRTVVSAAGYLPSGPLASLTLGNGVVETRDFDSRYYPDSIVVSGARSRTWNYQVDAVGNVTQIDDELACGTQDLVLSDLTVATTEVFESCTDLTVGPDFHVAAPADVTLRAAGSIGFENVVSVESGAVLRSESGADLGPPQLSTRTFGYQDYQYYLNLADGPWGAYDWTYDRIGNRLSEDDDGTLDTYDYEANAATTPGNLARLDQIQLGVGGIRDYTFGAAGHLEQVAAGANVVNFTSDSEGRLAGLERLGNTAAMLYDGRSFLERVDEGGTGNFVEPTYSSEGTLFSLFGSDDGGVTTGHRQVLYFSGRPVAILEVPSSGAETCTFLSTDHLGTPFVATGGSGVEVWSGGFEPFGRDWLAGTPEGAEENGVFLRFPGQWLDETWSEASLGAEVAYNVHRWYEMGTGRYSRVDPEQLVFDLNLHLYSSSRPSFFFDTLGLAKVTNNSCRSIVIKTEGGDNRIEVLGPGDSGKADGFFNGTADSCSLFCGTDDRDLVYKINTKTDVTITGGCGEGACLSWKTDDVSSALFDTLDPRRVLGRGPGWKGPDWFDEHPDWKPPVPPRPAPCCAGPFAPTF